MNTRVKHDTISRQSNAVDANNVKCPDNQRIQRASKYTAGKDALLKGPLAIDAQASDITMRI
jgi:hypothetical protein